MQRRKMMLWAAFFGALVGVLIVRLKGGMPLYIQNFGTNTTPLGRIQLIAACIPWLIFSLYWEIAAKNAAKTKSSETSLSRAVHLTLTNLALLFEIVQFSFLGRFLPASYPVIAAGFVVSAFGLFVAIWARRHLGRNWSGEITIKEEHELIRSGPYNRLRHPIYTGILIMYIGTAVITGTWLALVGLAIAALAYVRKIRLEEANMRVAFGSKYEDYSRESWALAPWIY